MISLPKAPTLKNIEPSLLLTPKDEKFQELILDKTKLNKKELKRIKQQLLADFLDLTERIIENLFQCGKDNDYNTINNKDNESSNSNLPGLSDFGWMIIHRCQLTFTNIILSLFYLIRLKQKHPTCKGGYGSGHRLFLAGLIVANKYLYDDAYHNHTWTEVTQGLFKREEVNRMEFELIYFLNFNLNVKYEQWYQLVDLLDHKLHVELINVGCIDSKRYRLSVECGITSSLSVKPNPQLIQTIEQCMDLNIDPVMEPEPSFEPEELSDIGSEQESESENASASSVHLLAKQMKIKMNIDATLKREDEVLPSPLQLPIANLKKRDKATPPTPKKMLHLPLHQLNTPNLSKEEDKFNPINITNRRKSSLLLEFNNSNQPVDVAPFKQRRGSLLRYQVSPSTNGILTLTPTLNKPLPTPPIRAANSNHIRLHSTASSTCLNGATFRMSSSVGMSMHMDKSVGNSLEEKKDILAPMIYFNNGAPGHPRRKSLPAFPITTNATQTVSFRVGI